MHMYLVFVVFFQFVTQHDFQEILLRKWYLPSVAYLALIHEKRKSYPIVTLLVDGRG